MYEKCFDVDEIFFWAEGENTFPSFRTQRSIENNISLSSEALLFVHEALSFFSFFFFFLPKQPLMPWWWLSYICLDECLWMQMLWCNVMCKWMAKHVSEAIFIAIIFLKTITPQLCIPLGTTLELLRLYFWRNQRWLFAVSSAFP